MQSGESNPLKEMIYSDTILLDAEVKDWQEAVRVSGELLVKTGAVETRYIEAMIDTVKTMGPYAVIAPGVALPHARPEDGVKRPCMSLITLKTPVNFGSADNDPVKLIVAFATIDNNAHVKALTRLARILGDPEKVEALKNAKNKQVVEEIVASPI
jgi:mannitol operon transcriptional antiterminator